MSEQEKLSLDMTDKQIASMAEKAFESKLITPDKIYLDLMLMRDFYIGTLMTFIEELPNDRMRESFYRYILVQIPEWTKRFFNDVERHFPTLKISNSRVRERMQDPAYADKIFSMSPTTAFVNLFDGHITLNRNHSLTIEKTDDIRVTINTFPLQLGKTAHDLIGAFMAASYGVNTTIICRDPQTLDIPFLNKFDELYIGTLHLISRGPGVADGISKMLLASKRIFATAIHGDIYPVGHTTEDIARWLAYLEKHYGLFCEYRVIPPKHLVIQMVSEDTEN